VIVRYRYRAYPTAAQAEMLARTFGCARVVVNDALRLRDAAHDAGEKISDTEVQRRVVTLAKRTPGREWLGEVASVALVQACQDARRADRNWFDSMSGKRKGREAGHPRFRSRKDNRQSARLTRNGFALHGGRVFIAKVGNVRVRWSRPLPSGPSSATVIRAADGRYYVSFVVERDAEPLPATGRETGADVGLDRLAVTSDGEIIANPRFLRAKKRHLTRAQRALSRKQKGSANRPKARHRVAVLHRKVRETRIDHAHKPALRPVRDSQAVYAEDLAVAEHYGRTFRRIGRFVPSGQVCSACGVKDGPKPLSVRTWTCGACGAVHDRDVNAARNILAAGQSDRLNACRGDLRPGSVLAVSGEAGTRRGAA
jgi:putative transposase